MRNKLRKFKRKTAAVHRRNSKLVKRVSRHPFAVPFFTFAFLLVVSAGLYVFFTRDGAPVRNAQVVIVNHDGVEQTVPSIEPTVGKLLKKLSITLGEGDVVEPSTTTAINQDDFRINIYRAVPVQIVDNGVKTYTFSAATTPRAIAKQTGSSLYAEDIVTADPVQNFVEQGAIGQQIVIDRSTPVNINLYGTPETVRTHADTVGELIKQKGISISSSDQVLPSPQTPIVANQQIFIAREGTKLESVTEVIPMPIQTIIDNNLAYGTSAVRQQGSAGQRVVTYQADAKNPKNRTVIQSIVTQEAVTQIVVQGASLSGIKGDMSRAGIAPSDFNYVDYIVEKESRWNPSARNASGAYGLCQALPGSKMASAGSDWATNPVTQLKWCDGYAKGRYGSWASAYSFWIAHHYW
jgi:resuscitation-promoting factor RpfB